MNGGERNERPRPRSAARALWVWARVLPLFLVLAGLYLFLSLFVSRRRLDPLLHRGTRWLVRALGLKVDVEGLERLDPKALYTFFFNHTSALDHVVLYSVLPFYGRGLEAAENFRIPVYGRLTRAIGNYPVERGHPERTRAVLERCAADARREGFCVFCAPEGTRTRDGYLGRLKSGVFRLAIALERPIVPLALLGLFEVLPPGEWRIRPGRVTVRVGEPIPVRGPDGGPKSIDALKSEVLNAWIAAGLKPRPEGAESPRAPPDG